jgi:WD40 repeat protein
MVFLSPSACGEFPSGLLSYVADFCEKGPIFATRFSKSGRWLLTAGMDGTVCVWNVKDKKLQMQYPCHTGDGMNIALYLKLIEW